MRPTDAFVRPRPVAAVDANATATQLTSGTCGPVGNTINSSIGGPGTTTAPMMTYFLADENDVDAALEAAGRDAESFKAAIQSVRHIRGKAAAPAHANTKAPKTSTPVPTHSSENLPHEHSHPAPPPRPTTPEAQIQHGQHGHAHSRPASSISHPSGPVSSIPPPFSPIFSQSGSASLFGTPGPASLSAMSSPSSRRNSLSSSFMIDDHLGGGGGDAASNHEASSDMESSIEAGRPAGGASFAPSLGTSSRTDNDAHSEADFGHDSAAAAAASFLLSSSSAGLSTVENSRMMDSGSAPQLVMPSIKMPSRRPFTEVGKSMGRLKVLLAGDTGLGKSSLIKAIVQSCPHIVHVDHISSPPLSLDTSRRLSATTGTAPGTADISQSTIRTRRKSSRSSRPGLSTTQIAEIYASTKPYPAWWNELSDVCDPRRRKSLGDNVLDRNICFVDTPGFTGSASPMDIIMPVVEHVESHLHKLCSSSLSLSDADFVGLVSGDGGTSVDVVLYLIADSLKPADIEFLRHLTPLTNVIPLLAQADLLRSDKDVASAKERIARQLHEANIKPFVFTVPTEERELALALPALSGLPQPYAVSSASGSDHNIMDASLLMSPDYVQPLVSTDLALLVEQVFCPDGVSRLKHAAARKCAQWRKGSVAEDSSADRVNNDYVSRPQSLYRPLNFGCDGRNELGNFSSSANTLGPGILTAPLGAPSSFALARITDHTQREEQLAQIRLANWAAELQRSLDNERAHYERLARSERAIWLTERLGECVKDGTLVAVSPAAENAVNTATIIQQQQQAAENALAVSSRKQQITKSKRSGRRSMWTGISTSSSSSSKLSLPTSFSHEDPLGLLDVTAGLRARGLFMLEVFGSLGVLGGVALWMTNHNYHVQFYEWAVDEWTKLWNGEN